MYCRKCGVKLSENSKYCKKCGEKVISKKIVDDECKNGNLGQNLSERVLGEDNRKENVEKTNVKDEKKLNNLKHEPIKHSNQKSSVNKNDEKNRKVVSGIILALIVGAVVYIAPWQNQVSQPINENDEFPQESSDDTISQNDYEESGYVEDTDDQNESEYIIQDSDTTIISFDDLYGLTDKELRLARNELYARHGRRFLDEDLQSYFDSCSWYDGTIEPDDFTDDMLNDIEKENKDTIVEYEEENGYR